MNCRDIERLLAEGGPLSAEAEEHIRNCAGCSELVEALAEPAVPADGVLVPSMLTELLPTMSPVKPLPTDAGLIPLTAAIFVALCVFTGAVIGLQGFAHLTPLQRTIYYGVIGFAGVLFSVGAVQAAIPGAKVRIGKGWVTAVSVVLIAVAATVLFPSFGMDHFVAQGFPCLRLGCICAALFGALAATVLRKGYVTDMRGTAVLIGCFAGLSGVAVLSLHCPLQNALHIIVWHLGAVAVSGLAGLAIGAMRFSINKR